MRPADCQRWVALEDAKSLGAALAAEDLEFARAHEVHCRECAVESAVWRSFARAAIDDPEESGARLGTTSPGEVALPDLVERILARASVQPAPAAPVPAPGARSAGGRGVRAARWVASAGVVAAAAAVAMVALPRHRPPAETATLASRPVTPSAAPPPAAELPSVPAIAPPPGFHCDAPSPELTVCLATDARSGPVDRSGRGGRLELTSGRVVVAVGGRGGEAGSFVVATPAGQVRASAALFSVEVDAQGACWARVERGRARVARVGAKAGFSVSAGQKARLDVASRPTALSAAEREADRAVLALEVAESEVPSVSRPRASTPEAGGGPLRQAPRDVALAPPAEPGPMLERARELFGRGAFAAAARAYEAAYEAFPARPEGRAALVALGDLRVSELDDPRGGLAAFDAYLAAPGGVLATEAEFGRIGALRALGERDEERAAAAAFLAAHPSDPRADALRRRLFK